jgi:hypothetical protein
LLSVALALVLATLATAVSALALQRARRSANESLDRDPLEQRLAEKERRLVFGLARRNTLAMGRASLFGGTGLGVWVLTGGSTYYPQAGAAFGLGLLGWALCGEFHRRIGSLADSVSKSRRRQGVDQS